MEEQGQQAARTTAEEAFSFSFKTMWATVDKMIDDFLALLPMVIVGIVVFVIFWLIAKTVRHTARRISSLQHSPALAVVIGRLAYFGLLILGFLIAVTIVFPSMTPARMLSLLGVGGVAIGFAFKDVFQNFLAGILILVRQPFRVGDEITTGSFTGTVEAIETRATFIKTYDGKRIIVPNSQIYTESVSVITAYNLLRTEYDFGIGYSDNIAQAKDIILTTVKGIRGVLSDPAPDVLTWELAGSSVNLRARWWTRPQRGEVLYVRDQVLHRVKDALSDAGIDLPFPTQVLLFHDQTEETDGDRSEQREGWPAGENPPSPRTLAMAIAGDSEDSEDSEDSDKSKQRKTTNYK